MNLVSGGTTAVFCAVWLFFAGPAPSQDMTAELQKAAEVYARLGAVNENHAYFGAFSGQWSVTTTMWPMPGMPPTVSNNDVRGELLMGGRFLKMSWSGMMMGQPFEGLQIIGFDNLQNKYITFWIDNTSTAFFLTMGTRDAAAKTMTEEGLWPDPMTGGKVKVRAVTKVLGADEFTYEMYMGLPNGREFKSMENHCLRKK